MSLRRFPRGVYDHGAEPDPRFTLANERTFLAWIRTSLALVAGGVALEALHVPIHPWLRLAASLALLVLGLVVPPLAWRGWAAAERAMRRGEPLPSSGVLLPLVVGVAAVALLLVLGTVLR
ncbi:YidH family protein [Actinosynnema sp.]|uniref:YidH family protein n=1 Tax=Actinosynnema sp. TaxID=1872144 RepID=UPI003F86973F